MADSDLILLKYSVVEWLWLNGVDTEVAEIPGRGWVTTPKTPPPLAASQVTERRAAAPFVAPAGNFDLEKLVTLQDFNAYLSEWKDNGLAKTAFSTVLGTGIMHPRLMVISDMPDDSEDRSGRAFSSDYNRLIIHALAIAGFDNDAVYTTYLSKWRAPSRRTLSPMEIATCGQMLRHEIALVAPDAILTLGEAVYRVLASDSLPHGTRFRPDNKQHYQQHEKNLPLMSSHKGEFLVKNPAMKKNFWFGLLEFAEILRLSGSPLAGEPDVNNAEYISDV